VEIPDRTDVSTTEAGLAMVADTALKSIPTLNLRKVITSFAGIRATATVHDFIIEESQEAPGFINVAGIESPGLSAAPAIACRVVDLLSNAGLALSPRNDFNPTRKPMRKFNEMTLDEQNRLIKAYPRYGTVVCRCEYVTEGDIVESIHRPAGARNVDAVKRRTRCGMGRCQGGFCTPRIMEILARELRMPIDRVTKKGGTSWLLAGRTK
jgi:glycerol-3-phosphate dehydrogenase